MGLTTVAPPPPIGEAWMGDYLRAAPSDYDEPTDVGDEEQTDLIV